MSSERVKPDLILSLQILGCNIFWAYFSSISLSLCVVSLINEVKGKVSTFNLQKINFQIFFLILTFPFEDTVLQIAKNYTSSDHSRCYWIVGEILNLYRRHWVLLWVGGGHFHANKFSGHRGKYNQCSSIIPPSGKLPSEILDCDWVSPGPFRT